jgi:hypothetical protein
MQYLCYYHEIFQYINVNIDAVVLVPWNGWFQASAEISAFQVYLSIFMQVHHKWNNIKCTQTSKEMYISVTILACTFSFI